MPLDPNVLTKALNDLRPVKDLVSGFLERPLGQEVKRTVGGLAKAGQHVAKISKPSPGFVPSPPKKTAGTVLWDSVKGEIENMSNVVKHFSAEPILKPFVQKAEQITGGIREQAKEFRRAPTIGKALGAIIPPITGAALPIGVAMEQAEKIPVIGKIPKAVSWGLEKIGEGVNFAMKPQKGEPKFLTDIKQNFLAPAFTSILQAVAFERAIKGVEVTAKGIKYKDITFTGPEFETVKQKVSAGESLNPREQEIAGAIKILTQKTKISPYQVKFPKEVIGVTVKTPRKLFEAIKEKWNKVTKTDIPIEIQNLLIGARNENLSRVSAIMDRAIAELDKRGGIAERGLIGLKPKLKLGSFGEARMVFKTGERPIRDAEEMQRFLESEQKQFAEQDAKLSVLEGFEKKDIMLFDRIRKLKESKFASGDIETMRKSEKYGTMTEKAVERYREVTGVEDDLDAFDNLLNLPSLKEYYKIIRIRPEGIKVPKEKIPIMITEEQGLKDKMKTLARGARMGFIGGKIQVKEIQTDLIDYMKELPLKDKGKFLAALKNTQTQTQLEDILNRVAERIIEFREEQKMERSKAQLRKQIGFLRKSKFISGETMGRIKELNDVGELKNASRSQLETIIDDLKQLEKGDTVLSRQHKEALKKMKLIPKELLEKKIVTHGKLRQGFVGNEDVLYNIFIPSIYGKEVQPLVKEMRDMLFDASVKTENQFDDFRIQFRKLLRKARKSRGIRLIPRDTEVIQSLEGGKIELTPQEQNLKDFVESFYATVAKDMTEEGRIRSNYFTHLKRGFLEAWQQDGFVEAFKLLFKEYDPKIDGAIWESLDQIVANQKFNPFALPREAGMPYSKDLSKVIEAYAKLYFLKQNFDPILPTVNAVKSLVNLPKSRDFLNKYAQSLTGRPLDLKEPKVLKKVINGLITYGYWRFLAFNFKAGLVNTFVGKAEAFIDQDIPSFLRGEKRFFQKRGQDILKKQKVLDNNVLEISTDLMEGFMGTVRAVAFFNMRGGGRVPWGENWIQGAQYLGELTKEEFLKSEISPERHIEILDKIGNIQGPYRIQQKPDIAKTAYGKSLTNYKQWLFGKIGSRIIRYKATFGKDMLNAAWGSKRFNKAQRSTFKELILAGIFLWLWMDEDDEGKPNKPKEVLTNVLQDMFGFADLKGWSWTFRSAIPIFGTMSDILDFFASITSGEVYKTDSKYGKKGELKAIPQGIRLLPANKIFTQIKEYLNEKEKEPSKVKRLKIKLKKRK